MSTNLYNHLYFAVKERYESLSAANQQQKANEIWSELKQQCKNQDELRHCTEAKIKTLKEQTTARKARFTNFFLQAPKKNQNLEQLSTDRPGSQVQENTPNNNEIAVNTSALTLIKDEESSPAFSNNKVAINKRPVQDAIQNNIDILEKKLNALLVARDSGLSTEEIEKMITKIKTDLENEKKSLKCKQQSAARKKKSRDNKRLKLLDLVEKIPEAGEILNMKANVGRSSLETSQKDLLEVIVNIATHGSGADDRRRTELIRSCKTLDDLHLQLQNHGYILSRFATYLRLIPRRANSRQGKKHVKAVPVKLIRAQTSEHKHHSDTEFATASIRALECLASFLGPLEVIFLSQDDKARIPLGITAANKQCAILMHMDYRVTLPDHDWVKAERHKLIPSVYAGIVIKENGMGSPDAVTYSGPTFISIRSGKHSSSTASSHANDIDTILNNEMLKPIVKTNLGLVKPIMIISVDDGPDENPRYEKVIKHSIDHFKNYNLDALFVVTNAPGTSAYNRVERRMAPLSHELAGVILPYDHFGNHLDNQGKTIDEEIEKQNFNHAGEVLCEIWNSLSIDNYSVEAVYTEREKIRSSEKETDSEWYATHVRESQYLLQVVKCNSYTCCGAHRSNLRKVLPTGFLPAPIKIKQTQVVDASDPSGKFMPLFVQLSVNIKHHAPGFRQIPYDMHCPSVSSQLSSRVCKTCGLYFASKKSVTYHMKKKHNIADSMTCSRVHPVHIATRRITEALCIIRDECGNEDAEWINIEDIPSEEVSEIETHSEGIAMELISNLSDWIKSPWTEQ